MGIELLVYCSPMEEGNEDVTGWEKDTVRYIVENKSKVCGQIRGIAKGQKKIIQSTEVEEIYSDLAMYLHNCDDYNLSKAVERSSTNSAVSLEGYVNTCIKFCVVRHCSTVNKEEEKFARDVINDDDGKELSLIDNVADTRSNESMDTFLYDLETVCKSSEIVRYKYGSDIYLIWYVRLLVISSGKQERLYRDILSVLGITKKELSKIEKCAVEDEMMVNFAKAVNIVGVDNAIRIIQPYVYSAKRIEETVRLYS